MEPTSQKGNKPARAEDIEFVKPSHGDIHDVKGVQSIQRNQFDPRHPMHRVLHPDRLNQLLKRVQTSMPGTGLQQFWKTRPLEKVTSGNQLSTLQGRRNRSSCPGFGWTSFFSR